MLQKQNALLQRITLIGLVAMMAVSTDLYLPAIPQLIEDLGATVSQGQLTLSVFLMGFAFGQLFYGNISDRHGRKPVIYIGLAIYLAGTLGVFSRLIYTHSSVRALCKDSVVPPGLCWPEPW